MLFELQADACGGQAMRVLLQDLGYAFRQLRKTPGFTVTVLLTLALGIGANSAIFTLVNAILLHNLPVTDPKTLIRIGDKDDCCVNGGWHDNGDYSLFATDTYYMFKKNLPEFEELAAMESGYAWRPITVRRAGPQTVAKSVMGTFVSGNYFRVFGLSPAAGRLFVDADDQKGAPITAVMSYDAWQQDYAGDPSVVGSAFYINTKPVTIIGVAPKGFYGDRIDTNPPKYFLPMNSMDAVIGAPYFTIPTRSGPTSSAASSRELPCRPSRPRPARCSSRSLRRSRHLPISAPRRFCPAPTWCSLPAAAASRTCRTVTRTT